MKNIFSKLFRFVQVSPPEKVKDSFMEKFGESINIEWLQTEDCFEAIFYLDDVEHIAHFDSSGKLHNLKKNLSILSSPEQIKQKAAQYGELMNVIEIIEDEVVGYEIIIRDEDLIRYSLLLNEKGGLIQKSKL
jgi:hypothetical protein